MASGEAEPLQYTTTTLRVSIHCEGCKKKVRKVLHGIEGVYKVTVDAAQHKVTVTGEVGADALLRRLHKAGKQAALWPSPAPVEAKKPEEATPAALPVQAGESCAKDAADAKPPKEAEAKEKPPEKGDGKEKKPAKDQKADKGDAEAKPNKDEASKDAEAITEPKETKKGSPEPAKQDAAEEPSGGGKKGKKNKKNKPKEGGEGEEAPVPAPAAPEKKPHQPQPPVPAPSPGPERPPPAAFPYYAAQPVLSYNVAHPSSSVSYYAPTPGVPMHPMPPPPLPPPLVVPYVYPPMVPVPAEFLYGPPGMRSSPPEESYNNMFNEDNANSCSLM